MRTVFSFSTTVPVGALTISTPYHAANPFDLGNMVLNPTGTRFEASARFPKLADPQIHITDTRAGQLGWTAYVTATNFAGPGTAAINAQNLALTGVTAVYTPGDALQAPAVSTFDVLSTAGTVYAPAASGTDGFAGPPAKKFVSTSAGASVGTVNVFGQLTLKAPASTPAGLYTSTVTFTIS